MSESLSGVGGTEVISELTGQTRNPATNPAKSGDPEESSAFPALFASVTDAQDDSLTKNTELNTVLPVLLDSEFFSKDPLQSNQAAYSTIAAYGNSLPQQQPVIALSGHIAVGDQAGAKALSFMGDGKQFFMSGPQSAATIQQAMQAAGQQLESKPALPALKFHDEAMTTLPMLESLKRSELNTLTSLSERADSLTPILLNNLQGSNQTVASPFMSLESLHTVNHTARPEPISVVPQHPQWSQEVGERINMIIAQGLKQAEIRLNPPELGLLEVRVQLQGDQTNIQFSSPHAQVREALDAALPRLREMLAETGLSLGNTDISQHGFAQHSSDQDQTDFTRGPTNNLDENEVNNEAQEQSQLVHLSTNSMLDVFA